MLYLELYQFTYSSTRSSQKPDYKIPRHFSVFLKLFLKVFVISFTDHIFKEWLLLHFYKRQFPLLLPETLQQAIYASESQIHSLWIEVFNQPDLVITKIFLRDFVIISLLKLFCGKEI